MRRLLARVGMLAVAVAAVGCHEAASSAQHDAGACSVRTGTAKEIAACGDYAPLDGTLGNGCYAASAPPDECLGSSTWTYWACTCKWVDPGQMEWVCAPGSCGGELLDGGLDAAHDAASDDGSADAASDAASDDGSTDAASDDGPTDAGAD
jgi:hypothetical protein